MSIVLKKLIKAYDDIAAFTKPDCMTYCKPAMSCCDKMYCNMAKEHAKEHYNINLEDTEDYKQGKTSLPMMNLTDKPDKVRGCIVSPYLRPSCSLHHCQINSLGCKLHDPDYTKEYFKLREKVEALELVHYVEKNVSNNLKEYFQNLEYFNSYCEEMRLEIRLTNDGKFIEDK